MKRKTKRYILTIVILLLFIFIYCFSYSKLEVVAEEIYVVKKGDTLWDIAKEQIDENVDVRDYIHLIKEYNDGLTPNINVGQSIILPILGEKDEDKVILQHDYVQESEPKPTIKYTSLEVPNIDSSFKTWMNYKAVTNKESTQYKFINTYGWSDNEGFMRCVADEDLGIDQDYYLIALGSFYGTSIGTKYRITLDTGKVFYGVLADCKADIHTNDTNQYIQHNGNVVEFVVDTSKLNKKVKRMGSANVYDPLNGNISKIERMDFVYE